MKTIKYVVTYRESADAPQESEEFFTKFAADHFALKINLNGGVAIVTEELNELDGDENEQDLY